MLALLFNQMIQREAQMNNRRWVAFIVILNLLACYIFGCIGIVFIGIFAKAIQPVPGFGDAVAIIYLEGEIVSGRPISDYGGTVYSEKIVEYLRRIQNDSSIKAVVLRIDSPGGSVVASRDIYEEIVATQKKGKPVVASFSEIAASGGYYVAAPADLIYAHPDAITGSIGVITVLTSIEGLLEKIGVKMIVIKSGAHKDESYGFRDLTPEERALWQAMIDEAYNEFVEVVAKGRHLEIAKVKQLADGRLFTGNQAKELGLVDELGNLEAAVDAAARLGKITGTPRKIEYRYQPGFFESIGMKLSPGLNQPLEDLIATRRWGRLLYLYVAP